LAIAAELKKQLTEVEIVYIGQRGDSLIDIPKQDPNIDTCYVISAGKFRRYHNEGWQQLIDLRTQYLNIRDVVRVISGFWQSWRLMKKIKPSIVFTRGGFVSVPVAMAAKLRRVPYITHDSDSTPSLANRIIARWATANAVALDPETYPYPIEKTFRVGVPIDRHYRHVSLKERQLYRKQLGLSGYHWVICVTGGGNGAKQLNEVIFNNAKYLLKLYPDLALVHIAGRSHAQDLSIEYDKLFTNQKDRSRIIVKDYVTDFYKYSGAADIVIARGGATNLAEFAAQGCVCIIIPSKQLVWNVRNAKALADAQAVIELSEDQAEQESRLANTVSDLLENPNKMKALTNKIIQFAMPDSTNKIVELILSTINPSKG